MSQNLHVASRHLLKNDNKKHVGHSGYPLLYLFRFARAPETIRVREKTVKSDAITCALKSMLGSEIQPIFYQVLQVIVLRRVGHLYVPILLLQGVVDFDVQVHYQSTVKGWHGVPNGPFDDRSHLTLFFFQEH
jgi:hypothetical protein